MPDADRLRAELLATMGRYHVAAVDVLHQIDAAHGSRTAEDLDASALRAAAADFNRLLEEAQK